LQNLKASIFLAKSEVHRVVIEDSGLLGYDNVSLAKWFLTF
jgi:hypothetical protein